MISSEDLIRDLNESQRQAVTHGLGPLLVLAGPGSGKTRVLTHRVAWLIAQGIESSSILALTFTNKAADELKNRLERLAPDNQVWSGTFHRFCSRLLRIYAPHVGLAENFTIYDTSDSGAVIKEAIELAEMQSAQISPDKIANEISRIKSAGLLPEDATGRAKSHLFATAQIIYPVYQQLLRQNNAVDFDDLLLYVVQLLRESPEIRELLAQRYQHVLVDEYQDTNQAQYLILKGMCPPNANLMVTGDPDQSIYGWRGASITNVTQFEQDFVGVQIVRLEQNYRSTQRILRAADQLILNNRMRKHKSLLTDNELGTPVVLAAFMNQQDEARAVADWIENEIKQEKYQPKDFAVLYRVNWLSRSFETELLHRGISYQIVHGTEFYKRREIKDVLAYLHLLNNPQDNIALQRVINVPPRQIGVITLRRIREYAIEHNISLLEACRQCGMIETVSRNVAAKVIKFVALYDELSTLIDERVESLIGHVISLSGYQEYLVRDGDEEGFQRAANVEELLSAAREFDDSRGDASSLELFLEQAVLVNETDAWQHNDNRVTLMTLHAAKGLEFPCVFIVGLEQGILPHERSLNETNELEEERRLLFVGITRAQQRLHLSYSLTRFRRGANRMTMPCEFLMELPREEMNVMQPRSRGYAEPAYETDPHEIREVAFEFADGDADHEHSSQAHPLNMPNTERERGSKKRPRMPLSPIVTATSLIGDETGTADPIDPDTFEFGMIVSHPTYGTGKIVAMSGIGKKRQATISFFNGKRQTFRLSFSGLRPVGK
ncbi:MAG TPA: UvrD-helicase domain-containing protein [Pirellulaceae bacterium]|nr:UvrD-helicase domain-containing protein [Pirellulaceae bacterium]HMO91868.1 UvrD-helicase domain-containing protein [Pirellulaceae bacterium]HMP69722.1 UvrD-helicase domain-containing protein [Pirellulaceae bacterium]